MSLKSIKYGKNKRNYSQKNSYLIYVKKNEEKSSLDQRKNSVFSSKNCVNIEKNHKKFEENVTKNEKNVQLSGEKGISASINKNEEKCDKTEILSDLNFKNEFFNEENDEYSNEIL